MPSSYRLAILFLLSSCSFVSHASDALSNYNLILIDDYNFTGGDVEGAALVGGDLNASGTIVVGSRLENTDTAIDALTVVGDINAGGITIENDNNLVYGGTLSGTVNLNDGDDGQSIQNPNVSISDVIQELYASSAYYAGLEANGTFDNNNLSYTGNEDIAVFNVDSSQVFAQNAGLSLLGTSGKTVIINVNIDNANNELTIPSSVNLNNGFNGQSAFSSILWNFYDATEIDFGALNFKGSVLAPYAHTFGSANVDGAYAALSFTGAREYHNYLFDGPDISTTQVSAPSMLALLVLSFGFMFYNRRLKA